MGYSIVRKAKVLKTVGEDCEGLKQFSKPVEVEAENRRFKISYSYDDREAGRLDPHPQRDLV